MSLPAKTCTCPCGNVLDIPVVESQFEPGGFEYEVCNLRCPKCRRVSGGGNFREGTVDSWMTARQEAESQAEYERQCFSADMNEWYGRGNHPF